MNQERPLRRRGLFAAVRVKANEYPQGAGRICNAPSSRTAQCGISECAFWILYTLRAEERQFTQAEICEFLIEPKQTVHFALKKLEAEGYLARTSSADLRSKHVALTEKGEQFARTWIDRVPEAETAALGAMPEEECAAFVRGCICSAGCWRKGSARTAQFKG